MTDTQSHAPETTTAEQLGEGLDPVQRRLQPGLGPTGQQGLLDLLEGLGEPGGGGGLTHLATSLGRGHPTRRFAMSTTAR